MVVRLIRLTLPSSILDPEAHRGVNGPYLLHTRAPIQTHVRRRLARADKGDPPDDGALAQVAEAPFPLAARAVGPVRQLVVQDAGCVFWGEMVGQGMGKALH